MLCLVLLASPAYAASMVNFETLPAHTYFAGQFSDVDENQWYGANVQGVIKQAVELGIVAGLGNGTFDPLGSVRVSEALKMACVVRDIYFGGSGSFEQGFPWYQVYVDRALENGIITAGEFADYDAYATRAQVARIFAASLPAECFAPKNTVKEIPDVSEADGAAVYLLYRAGVLTGNSDFGEFMPDAHISRAETAALITRVALPEQRRSFTLQKNIAQVQSAGSIDEFKQLYLAAVEELAPSLTVKTGVAVHDAYWSALNSGEDWSRSGVESVWVSYDSGKGEMTIEFTAYTLHYQVERVIAQPQLLQRASAEAAVELKRVRELTASIITEDMTDRETLLALHDYMVSSYHYDLSFAEESFSFTGLLNNSNGVCQAYAELYALLAQCAGIDCRFVSGTANAGMRSWESHAWNSVTLDGQVLYIDVTFDDPLPDTTYGVHSYFLVTAEALARDHAW